MQNAKHNPTLTAKVIVKENKLVAAKCKGEGVSARAAEFRDGGVIRLSWGHQGGLERGAWREGLGADPDPERGTRDIQAKALADPK